MQGIMPPLPNGYHPLHLPDGIKAQMMNADGINSLFVIVVMMQPLARIVIFLSQVIMILAQNAGIVMS